MARILAVDDSAESLLLLRRSLEPLGHKVIPVQQPIEALRQIHAAPFDLIILDIVMPGVDGLELCKEVRSSKPNRRAKVVIFSAHSQMELARLAQRLGANFYLCKPATVDSIQAVVARLLGPTAASPQASAPKGRPAPAPRKVPPCLPLARVVVVDDDASARKTLAAQLAHLAPRAQLTLVGEAHEAADAIERVAPDLVVLDHKMPRADGKSILEELRRRPATWTLPVLIYSAYRLALLYDGIPRVAFLEKPATVEQLAGALEALLGQGPAGTQAAAGPALEPGDFPP